MVYKFKGKLGMAVLILVSWGFSIFGWLAFLVLGWMKVVKLTGKQWAIAIVSGIVGIISARVLKGRLTKAV
jgi:hypothetical protein